MFGSKRKKGHSGTEPSILQPSQTTGKTSSVAAKNSGEGTLPENNDAQRRTAIALRRSAALAQIITVLMRSSQHKHLALADLEWLVFPPLLTGQFSVAQLNSKDGKTSVPAAVVLWASVSPEVDKRLSESLNSPVRLRPDEWKSGDILWLIEAVGDSRVLPSLLKQLSEVAFKGKDVKVPARGDQGKVTVQSLRAAIAAQASTPATRK
jgi:hemolysin-activating ACP:hemolysin acyltransferase